MIDEHTHADQPNQALTEATLEEAMMLVNKPELSESEIHSMIATLAATIGLKTVLSKYIPKGTVLIGTGETLAETLLKPRFKL